MFNFLLDTLVNQLSYISESKPDLQNTISRVRGSLKKYAEYSKTRYEQLTVLQIASNPKNLDAELTKFIKNHLPFRGSPDKVQKRQNEIICRISSLVFHIFAKNLSAESQSKSEAKIQKELSLQKNIPKWMKPIVEILPREKNKKLSSNFVNPSNEVQFSQTSILLIMCLHNVIKNHLIASIDSLLLERNSEINEYIDGKFYGKQRREILQTLHFVERKLGFRETKPARILKKNQWPELFLNRWNAYVSVAEDGLPENSAEIRLARQYNLELNPTKKKTLKVYLDGLEIGLYYCDLPPQWDLKDLLTLKIRTIEFQDGTTYQEFYNEYVDNFRERERNRQSISKRIGYDSSIFAKFKIALVNIAISQGLSHLVKPFRDAYKVKLDRISKEKKKARKNKLYTINDIDEDSKRLKTIFDKYIKDGSFNRTVETSIEISNQAIDLCIFYPMLLVMRFLGLRQMNVRNFSLMKNPNNPDRPEGNIGFRKDGTIVIHFTDKEMKNGKCWHFEFSKKTHGETHGELIYALNEYKDKIYPYILENADVSLDGQFFARRRWTKFTRLKDDGSSFTGLFKERIEEYMKFEGINVNNYETLTPHHMRRTCINCLYRQGYSLHQIADYVADTVQTIENEYLDKNRTYNPTKFTSDRNAKLVAEKEQGCKQCEKNSKDADKEIFYLKKQNKINEKRIDFLEKHNQSLEKNWLASEEQLKISQKREKKLTRELNLIKRNNKNINKGGICL